MKISNFLAEIVTDFSGFHRSPDFKASRSTGEFKLSEKSSGKSSRRSSTESTGRKHSINITIALGEVPTITPSDLQNHRFVKNSNSSPAISRMASLNSLQERIQRRLKRSTSLENLIEEGGGRKMSTSSYRVIA